MYTEVRRRRYRGDIGEIYGPTPTLSLLSRGTDDDDEVSEPPSSSSSSLWPGPCPGPCAAPARRAAGLRRRCRRPAAEAAPAAEAEAASACGQENTPPGPGDIVGRRSGLGPSEPGGLVEADAGDDASAASPAALSSLLCCDASAARCCATPPGGMTLSSTLCSCCPRASSSSVNELVRCMATRRLKLRRELVWRVPRAVRSELRATSSRHYRG